MVNGTVIRRRFSKPAKRFNKSVDRTLPPRIPAGQVGRKMKVSEAERRLIARTRSQRKTLRRVKVKGLRPI